MPVDWSQHIDVIYSVLGVSAVLTLAGTDGTEAALTVIAKTEGVDVGDEIHSVKPAADVRMAELMENGLSREDVNGATLTFSGESWTVITHALRPTGDGSNGELRMILNDDGQT